MEPERYQTERLAMPVDFSVKRVPDAVARRLRERAQRHHRSLQRELLWILEAASTEERPLPGVAEPAPGRYAGTATVQPGERRRGSRRKLTLDELWERAQRLGPPIGGEAAARLIRRERDERSRR
ncbi:MAG: Arc family DNA-binding protein [Gammaproteobacteria bacterium]|nr:MAG: Arc family DNA-binding protein [Gammaproteobacteria bacterium]